MSCNYSFLSPVRLSCTHRSCGEPRPTSRIIRFWVVPAEIEPCRGKRWASGSRCTPYEFPTRLRSGIVGRTVVQLQWALTRWRIRMQTRRRSRVSRAGCTHTQNSGQTDYNAGYSHGDRPHMAIADVHHTCHIIQIKCTRKHNHTASPSPQFVGPQRGRKRLSREAILHTILALEWPELVQIGRCKVQWLRSDANKRMLTSFYSEKTITQHHHTSAIRNLQILTRHFWIYIFFWEGLQVLVGEHMFCNTARSFWNLNSNICHYVKPSKSWGQLTEYFKYSYLL